MDSETNHDNNCQGGGSTPVSFGVIELARVDFSDTTFRITTRTDISELVLSIGCMGVLVPPLVKPDGDRLIIVSGFLRLDACRSLNLTTVTARLIPADASELSCARCAVAENRLQRQLNPLEMARGVALLAASVPEEGLLAAEVAAAGLSSNPDMTAKLLLAAKLPAAVQARLVDGTIGLAMALMLGDQAPEFSSACADLFGQLGIGLNRQREILGLISEIAARDEISPLDLIGQGAIRKIYTDADLERPLKVRMIRDWLYSRRYPNLARAQERFEEHRSRLKLGNRIQLKAPRFFESDQYTLSLQFSDIEGLRACLKRMEGVIDDPCLQDILSRSQSATRSCR